MTNRFEKSAFEEAIPSDISTHAVVKLMDGTFVPPSQLMSALPVILKCGYKTLEVPGILAHRAEILKFLLEYVKTLPDVESFESNGTPETEAMVLRYKSGETVKINLYC